MTRNAEFADTLPTDDDLMTLDNLIELADRRKRGGDWRTDSNNVWCALLKHFLLEAGGVEGSSESYETMSLGGISVGDRVTTRFVEGDGIVVGIWSDGTAYVRHDSGGVRGHSIWGLEKVQLC